MISFKAYKKRVESVRYEGFRLVLSDIAKWPGDFVVKHYYAIHCRKPSVVIPCAEPFVVRSYDPNKSILDERVQLTKKELMGFLRHEVERFKEWQKENRPR